MERWLRRAQLARRLFVFVVGTTALLRAAPVTAQDAAQPRPEPGVALTLPRALDLARERAPRLIAERLRIDEARGRLVGASVRLRDNPVIEGGAGYRWAPAGDSTTEGRAAVSQSFELGGQRGLRIDGARAQVARARALSEEQTRQVLREVALSFVRALHGRDRLELARSIERVAEDVVHISERRSESGDIAALDLTLAQASLARARADVHAAEAVREESLGALRVCLGLSPDEALLIEGDLAGRREFDIAQLEARASRRADIRVLEAVLRETQSDRELGAAARWPELGLGASYERHENANIMLGTASLTLPLFERGQGLRAEAEARRQRLLAELRARKNAVSVEVRAASAIYERRLAAVEELERGALPLLDQSEAQLRRGYEAGQLGLVDFLAVRREIVATRIEYADRLLDAGVAAVELDASGGLDPQAESTRNPFPRK